MRSIFAPMPDESAVVTSHRPRRAAVAGFALAAAVLLSAAAPQSTGSPVADAAMRRDTAQIRQLLRQGADVNAAQGDGMTALHWAARHGDASAVRMLVYAGARVDVVTRNGNYTPLHLAARAGSMPVVKALVDAGANVHAATTAGGSTALHFAAAQGSAEIVQALLDHGAKADVRDSAWSQTPLMWASAYDRLEAMNVLIAAGADIQATSKVENIPERERLARADNQARNRRVAALRAADAPARGGGPAGRGGGRGGAPDGRGNAPPSQVAQNEPPSSGRGGFSNPEMPGASREQAQAAAPAAERGGREGRAGGEGGGRGGRAGGSGGVGGGGGERSLSYGELVGNKGGLTPLLFAVRQGNTNAAVALLDAGADVNQVSGGDHTSPLLMAAINGHFDLAKLLLERGANVKLASDAGATPLYATINVQWAAKSLYPQPTAQHQQKTTHLELMERLLEAGADPNARLSKHLWYMSYNFDLLGVNTTGATPFWRAAYGLDVPAMKLLVKYGADHTIPTTKPAGRQRGDDAPSEDDGEATDPSGLPPVPSGGPGVYPIHAASGVGYGEGYAANAHRHAPDGWLPAMKYLIEELGHDVNARDHNGYNAIHHAAARGDNKAIEYLVSKGGDVKAVSRRGQTTADMANGPVQRIPPFLETVALLEKLGAKNNNRCRSC